MELKNKLVEKVKNELIDVSEYFTQDEINSFLEWMKIEYVNYFSLTRETALNTLKKLKNKYSDYECLINVLEINIQEYASLECYYKISISGIQLSNN